MIADLPTRISESFFIEAKVYRQSVFLLRILEHYQKRMVKFINNDRAFKFSGKRRLAAFIDALFLAEGKTPGQVQYVFSSDDYVLQVNRDFLAHDYYTDIITFDLRDSKTGPVDAEIYISLDRVKDNAKNLSVSFREEALRVIFHGALHLCGYGDKTKREITVMRAKESEYLRKFESVNPQ